MDSGRKNNMRKTKIICTIGPSVESDEMIRALIENGMDAARMNFSHGSHEEHRGRIERIRRISEEMGVFIPIILDTKGPEIRTKTFKDGSAILKEDSLFTLYPSREEEGDENGVAITYPYLAEDVEKGTKILIDDGLCSLEVMDIVDGNVTCKVLNTARISNHKSINVPGVDIDMPFISDTDRSDILFGIEMDVDFIAASFVRTAEDVKRIRKLLAVNGANDIRIISKIECKSGIDNLNAIIEASDGVMVARGDLGVEIPFKELPAIQKNIIKKCYESAKIVVTATQMLESMTEHSRPTRAEVSDVANAIYDGTTCTMLSGETAAGKYPIEAVRTMAEIAEYTENQIDYRKRYFERQLKVVPDIPNTIANAAVDASFTLGAKAIICMSAKGRSARMTSSYHPSAPIIACVTDTKAQRQLRLDYGVYPIPAPYTEDKDELANLANVLSQKTGLVKKGDLAVIITGTHTGYQFADSLQLTRLS